MALADLIVSNLALAQELKETVNVRKFNDPDYQDIALGVEMVIVRNQTPDQITPEGRVIKQPDYEGVMLNPDDRILETHIVFREGKPRLAITFAERIANVQYFEMEQNVQ